MAPHLSLRAHPPRRPSAGRPHSACRTGRIPSSRRVYPRPRGKSLRDHGNVRVTRHSSVMGYDIPAAAAEIARWQAGAISRRQLLDAGLSIKLIERRLLYGRWQQLYRGVYAVFSGPPSRNTWLWAAVLRAGRGAVLSYLTAAELHGLIDSPAEAIFVTVPSSRRITTRGIIVRTSSRVGQATQPGREPPRTGVEETVLDLVELAQTFDDACGWITRACGRRLSTEKKLRAAMAVRKKNALAYRARRCSRGGRRRDPLGARIPVSA